MITKPLRSARAQNIAIVLKPLYAKLSTLPLPEYISNIHKEKYSGIIRMENVNKWGSNWVNCGGILESIFFHRTKVLYESGIFSKGPYCW